MKIRINIGDQHGNSSSHLIETDKLEDGDLKSAILYAVEAPGKIGHSKKFGKFDVIHGEVTQDGYEMNEEIRKIEEKEETIEISVITFT